MPNLGTFIEDLEISINCLWLSNFNPIITELLYTVFILLLIIYAWKKIISWALNVKIKIWFKISKLLIMLRKNYFHCQSCSFFLVWSLKKLLNNQQIMVVYRKNCYVKSKMILLCKSLHWKELLHTPPILRVKRSNKNPNFYFATGTEIEDVIFKHFFLLGLVVYFRKMCKVHFVPGHLLWISHSN